MIKTTLKLSGKNVKSLPDLIKGITLTVDPLEHFIEIYRGKEFVGAAKVEYKEPKLDKNLKPVFSLFVHAIEVKPEQRRKTYGTKLVDFMKTKLPVYEIKLVSLDDASKKFWSKNGFKTNKDDKTEMIWKMKAAAKKETKKVSPKEKDEETDK